MARTAFARAAALELDDFWALPSARASSYPLTLDDWAPLGAGSAASPLFDLGEAHVSAAPLEVQTQPADGGEIMSLGCGCGCGVKNYTAFVRDGVGDPIRTRFKLDNVTNPLLLDNVGGDTTQAAQTITVGQKVYGVIEDLGDQDFFAVTLTAGKTYAISNLLHVGGTLTGDGTLLSGVPLADAFVELYAADGTTLLASADGGSNTTPSGLDAKLFFTATTTGTYYVNARAFDQDATNGTKGDFVGDYTVQVREVPASAAPLPRFYSSSGQNPNPLLDSLDWGNQWRRTSRNPDGDNGTRTDNTVPNGGGSITDSTYGITGKNVLTYYIARQGDVFLSADPLNPGLENMLQARNFQDWEVEAFMAMFAEYEKVADLKFVQVDDRADADLKLIIYPGTPGVGASVLGRMSPPGEQNEGQMEINAGDVRWTQEGVKPGGFYFPTLLHELGHGLGMKHPHDTGGGGPEMEGAGAGTTDVIGGQYGAFGLSQGIYTMMSYNDGWSETGGPGGRPAGHGGPRTGGITGTEVDGFGHIGTMAALDIAVIQDKYGVNEEHARGDDVYVIADENKAGNYYRTIWDGGGDDEIRYEGARNANIDLRAATLKYEEGGGGRVSYALGAWTGFTIANGVTIEKATSGSGDDTLTGNSAANILSSGDGRDTLFGSAGSDIIEGGGNFDTVNYSLLNSTVWVNMANGTATKGDGSVDLLRGVEHFIGSGLDDRIDGSWLGQKIGGGAGADNIFGDGGDDEITGGAGADIVNGGDGDDTLVMSGLRGEYSVSAHASVANTFVITDSVANRDGADQFTRIEWVRFSNGETVRVADLLAAASPSAQIEMESDKGGADTPLVLPDMDEDEFVFGAKSFDAWTQPTSLWEEETTFSAGAKDFGFTLDSGWSSDPAFVLPEPAVSPPEQLNDWM